MDQKYWTNLKLILLLFQRQIKKILKKNKLKKWLKKKMKNSRWRLFLIHLGRYHQDLKMTFLKRVSENKKESTIISILLELKSNTWLLKRKLQQIHQVWFKEVSKNKRGLKQWVKAAQMEKRIMRENKFLGKNLKSQM